MSEYLEILAQAQPCPFCRASELDVGKDHSEDDPSWVYAYHVYCRVCGCKGRNRYAIGWCESPKEAVEAWNDRGVPSISEYTLTPWGPVGQFALRSVNAHPSERPLCLLYDFSGRASDAVQLRSHLVECLNQASQPTQAPS